MRFFTRFSLLAITFTLLSCSQDRTPENKQPENGSEKAEKSKEPDAVTLEQFDLKPGAAGFIPVGITADSLKKLVPAENLQETVKELEGMRYTAFEIRNRKNNNELLLIAEESCEEKPCKIFRIRIVSPKFSTKEGLRVGSTFGEVKKTYLLSFVGLGEADFVALSEKQRMAFTLDISNFPPKPLYKIKTEEVPDSAAVTSILLF